MINVKIFTGNGNFVTLETASREQLAERLAELEALDLHNCFETAMGHAIAERLGVKFYPISHPDNGWYSRTR
jgi:hypothetical protein